jgi:hypothetical protein
VKLTAYQYFLNLHYMNYILSNQKTLRVTLAMAAGVADRTSDMNDVAALTAAQMRPPRSGGHTERGAAQKRGTV